VTEYPSTAYLSLPLGQHSNMIDVDAEADFHLDAAQQEFQVNLPESATYAGLLPIGPDGAIQSVTWSMGPAGVTTRATRNTEMHRPAIGYRERRFVERLANPRAVVQQEVRKLAGAAAMGGLVRALTLP
jgi:hypothetical protein